MKKNRTTLTIIILCFLIVFSVSIFAVVYKRQSSSPSFSDLTTALSTSEKSETTTAQTETVTETGAETTLNIANKIETETSLHTTTSVTTQTQVQTSQAVSKITSVCGKKYVSKETGRIVVDPDNENWYLVVVNAGREYVSTYKPELAEIVKGSGKYLDKRVAPHYDEMYAAAKKDGITLVPYSAYRSYQRQKNNYENLTSKYMTQYSLSKEEAAKKAATVILPPGTSEHNLGLAIDICNVLDSFANSKEYAWLMKHAQDYGFILRYTAEKQPITGIVPEPWHWRYVGVENAKKIKASGLCLEEYLDSLGIEY